VLVQHKLGLCLLRDRRLRGALSTFETVLKQSGGGVRPIRAPSAMYRIADVLFAQSRYAEALQRYREVVEQYPRYLETPWGLYQIAAIHTRRGEQARVEETLKVLREDYAQDYWTRQAAWRWPALR
ncbi:MAG: tetratricopeptide repeat protein, partial [Chitinivibrionales bacterium]|nr:tetratricopeptide repeat protein [Chitinivibrionales bacterium]